MAVCRIPRKRAVLVGPVAAGFALIDSSSCWFHSRIALSLAHGGAGVGSPGGQPLTFQGPGAAFAGGVSVLPQSASLPEAEGAKLVSVGRYALRGVGRAQELFTLDPELAVFPPP